MRSKRDLRVNAFEQQLKALHEKSTSRRNVLSEQASSEKAKLSQKQLVLSGVRRQLDAYRRVSIGTYLAKIMHLVD